MDLTDVFGLVRRSIVAFASKVSVSRSKTAPAFPTIIGTGFVIDERGIVATNRHVVEVLEGLPAHPKTGESAAMALAFSEIQADGDGHSVKVAFTSIRRWDKLTSLKAEEPFYGEAIPDVAFAQLNVSGIPALPLATADGTWSVGRSIATAGFPLGEQALVIYDRVNQVAPLLRAGVIASVYPFPCPRPHGFTVDIMTLGGESGSPIFRAEEPVAVGLLHAGFDATNITLAVPSWFVAQAFDAYLKSAPLDFANVPTFEELTAGEGAPGLKWVAV